MNDRITLKTECQIWKAKAETWEQAFNKLVDNQGITKTEQPNKELTVLENFQAGEEYALKHVIEVHGVENEAEFGVQNAWWGAVANWLKAKAVEYIVGALKSLVKNNIVKLADWLMEQVEDKVVDGFKMLDEQDQALLKNELKEHPRFNKLLEKLN